MRRKTQEHCFSNVYRFNAFACELCLLPFHERGKGRREEVWLGTLWERKVGISYATLVVVIVFIAACQVAGGTNTTNAYRM